MTSSSFRQGTTIDTKRCGGAAAGPTGWGLGVASATAVEPTLIASPKIKARKVVREYSLSGQSLPPHDPNLITRHCPVGRHRGTSGRGAKASSAARRAALQLGKP